MREFDSFLGFAEHLAVMAIETQREMHKGIEKALVVIEKTAKSELGHYQPEVGPFPAWAPLADSTLAKHEAYGVGDTPLILTGGLYGSISHETDGLEGVVGSDSDVMVYQELGTEKIPPRPVLGPAAVTNHDKVEKILGESVAKGMLYGAGINFVALED